MVGKSSSKVRLLSYRGNSFSFDLFEITHTKTAFQFPSSTKMGESALKKKLLKDYDKTTKPDGKVAGKLMPKKIKNTNS